MYKLSAKRIAIILAICFIGFFLAVPNFLPKGTNLPSWWKPVSLGLDLQGGSNLLLEVKMDEVLRERMATIEDSVRQILRENRIRYQNLTATDDSVRVKVDNPNARSQTLGLLRNIEEGMEVKVVDGDVIEIKYSELAYNQLQAKVVAQSIEIVRRRIDELGTKEPTIQSQGQNRIVVQLPGIQNPEEVKQLLGKTAKMSFHLVDARTNAADARRGKLSSSSRVVPGINGGQYVITRKAVVDGANLVDAGVSFQEGSPVVTFKFDTVGGRKFAEVTKAHVKEELAIVLDNQVISAPTIQGAIVGGSGVITGNFSSETANELAMLLRSGALPAPLEVLEERTVGAGLGADSIKAGLIASVIGLIFVILF